MKVSSTLNAIKKFFVERNHPLISCDQYLKFDVGEVDDDQIEQYVNEINKIVNDTQHVNVDIHRIKTLSKTQFEFICKYDTKPGYVCDINVVYHNGYIVFKIGERKKKLYERLYGFQDQ